MTVLAMASCAAAYADGQPSSGEKSAGQAWLERQDSATRAMLEMYGATEEYLAMQAQMDDIVAQQERAEAAKKSRNRIIALISLAVALVPTIVVIRMAIQGKFEKPSIGAMISAAVVLILGGALLFALNFGWLQLRVNYGREMNIVLAALIVVALTVVAIVFMRKNKPEE